MKKNWVTIFVILGVIVISFFILMKKPPETPEEAAKCIGKNSKLYAQLGCHACETQKNIFGKNYKYLEVIDCFYERDKCSEISATPTWLIKGISYEGVQSIDKLKELTGC